MAINLYAKKNIDYWDNLSDKEKRKCIEESQLSSFLKTLDPSPLCIGSEVQIFCNKKGTHSFLLKDHKVYVDDNFPLEGRIESFGDAEGVVVPLPQHLRNDRMICVLCNGDYGTFAAPITESIGDAAITISFNCLANFYKGNKNTTIHRLAIGKLALVDFIADQKIKLSESEMKCLKEYRRVCDKNPQAKFIKPPKPGFSLVGSFWHRSATVVFVDKETNECILMGTDSGSYFACELPLLWEKRVSSVDEAYAVLIPDQAKGKDFSRQGEWFAVPISSKAVPDESDCVLCFTRHGEGSVWMPREKSGSCHYLDGDGRVGKDGTIYVKNLCMIHELGDHPDMRCSGWVTIHKNCAIRSFSEGGVD